MERPELERARRGKGSVTLRAFRADDARQIVDIYSRLEPDGAPLTLEAYLDEYNEGMDERWVAAAGEQIVGVAKLHPAWWTGQPEIYAVELWVEPTWSRQGIGTRLYEPIVERLNSVGAERALSWVRSEPDAGLRFALRHGFHCTGQVVEDHRLYVPQASVTTYVAVNERLRQSGVRIVSLAELDLENKAFLHALHAVWSDNSEGIPRPDELAASFETWKRSTLEGPGLSPETHWVALEGDQPVGLTFLKRLSATAAENDYTGVAASHRGNGIAVALKLRAIQWAQRNGVDWFYTSSEIGNSPMLSINQKLGYRAGVRRIEVGRDIHRT